MAASRTGNLSLTDHTSTTTSLTLHGVNESTKEEEEEEEESQSLPSVVTRPSSLPTPPPPVGGGGLRYGVHSGGGSFQPFTVGRSRSRLPTSTSFPFGSADASRTSTTRTPLVDFPPSGEDRTPTATTPLDRINLDVESVRELVEAEEARLRSRRERAFKEWRHGGAGEGDPNNVTTPTNTTLPSSSHTSSHQSSSVSSSLHSLEGGGARNKRPSSSLPGVGHHHPQHSSRHLHHQSSHHYIQHHPMPRESSNSRRGQSSDRLGYRTHHQQTTQTQGGGEFDEDDIGPCSLPPIPTSLSMPRIPQSQHQQQQQSSSNLPHSTSTSSHHYPLATHSASRSSTSSSMTGGGHAGGPGQPGVGGSASGSGGGSSGPVTGTSGTSLSPFSGIIRSPTAWLQRKIHLRPQLRGVHLITDELLKQLPELSDFLVGLCHIQVMHTSASLALNEVRTRKPNFMLVRKEQSADLLH